MNIIAAACDLASNYGYPVFPCRPDKKPLTEHGFKDATTDLDLIEQQFLEHPHALVGVPTGDLSGFFVVDIDPDGEPWYEVNRERLACARVHKTRRGLHLLFRMPPNAEIRNSAGKIAPGVDVRGNGGYIIWWPAHGLEAQGALDDLMPPQGWLLELIHDGVKPVLQPTGVRRLVTPAKTHQAAILEGGRNASLTSLAGAMRRANASQGEIEAALLAFNGNRCSPPLPVQELQSIARSVGRYEPAPAAKLDLRVTKNGVIPDEENVLRILRGDPNLQGIVRFDEFAGEMILARPIDEEVVGERGTPRAWTDMDTVTLQTYIQRFIVPRMGREKIEAVVAMFARKYCAFHPVRDYLQALEWDGKPRLHTWLRDYMGATEQRSDYLGAVGARWLISAVARILDPGCQADSAIVLEGPQGIFKSTALRTLSGDEYFSDSLPADVAHKDARDHLRGKWIIELSELAQFRRGEIETIKAFISRRHEQYRPSYGRHEVKFPRQCVFAGTTNADEYLVDTTGNRRFWAVACKGIDLPSLARDRDQLWAESTARYRAGEPWFLSGDLANIAATEAQARVAHDPWTGHVADILDSRLPPITEIAPGEVLALMDLGENERHSRNAARVAQILRDLGWIKGARHMKRGQLYARGMKL